MDQAWNADVHLLDAGVIWDARSGQNERAASGGAACEAHNPQYTFKIKIPIAWPFLTELSPEIPHHSFLLLGDLSGNAFLDW